MNDEKLTATDELRRMLDERGVEHFDGYDYTEWDADGIHYIANDHLRLEGRMVLRRTCTPEQAIEATLGRGKCHAIVSDNLTESEGTGDAWADCSECGHLLCVLTDPSSQMPNYCPNCGRKVVGA